MTRDEIYERIVEILADSFELEKDEIKPESTLYEELDLDSIDAIDIFVQLREMTGRRPDPEDARKIRTVEELVQFVLDEIEKLVFKTAFELDQRWLIELAGERAPHVCQSQSLNLFLAADVHKRDLHQIHFQAWKKGVKSLYYCRSKSLQRAETARGEWAGAAAVPHLGRINSTEQPRSEATNDEATDYDECLACQ